MAIDTSNIAPQNAPPKPAAPTGEPINLFDNPKAGAPIPVTSKTPAPTGQPVNLFDTLTKVDNLPATPTQADQTKEGPLFKAGPVLTDTGAKVANAVTSSEQNFGKDISQGFYLAFGGQNNIDKVTQEYLDNGAKLTELAKKQTDPTLKQKYSDMAVGMLTDAQKVGKGVIGDTRTSSQIVGDALGTATDVVLSGSLNNEAESFKLLNAADKAKLVENGVKTAKAYNALSTADKLAALGRETAVDVAKGAGTGYAMDVSKNLQAGQEGTDALKPGLATAIGAAAPLVIGGVKMGATALQNPENAGRVVNSLIKPLGKDFAYGKNPGQAIAEEGITGNSLEDLGANVKNARKEIGQMIGQQTSSVEGKATVDLSRAMDPIDQAIENAQNTPETNKALINRLQSIKSDLANYIGGDGKNLTFAEAIDAKGTVGDLTKWTGNPSDDKAVNSALKQVYGVINNQTMSSLYKADPEVAKSVASLNDKYGSLISAENAINHRDTLLQRQNLVGFTGKIATATGLIASILTGNILPALTGASEAVAEKALSSTLVKTKLATWMADQTPGVLDKLYKANPVIRNVLIKATSSASSSQ